MKLVCICTDWQKVSLQLILKYKTTVIQSSTLHATIPQERIYDNVSDFHHTSYYKTLLQQDYNTPHRNMTQ